MEKIVLTPEEEHRVCQSLITAGLSADVIRSLINDTEMASYASLALHRAINEKKRLEAEKKSEPEKAEKPLINVGDYGTHYW